MADSGAMSDRLYLKDIATALKNLTWSRVKAMCVQLDMELSTLTQIEQKYSDVSDRTLHSMDIWRRNDPEPTWARIVTALNAIDENSLATRIKQQHCRPMETPPTSPDNQPVAASNNPSPPGTSSTSTISTSFSNQINPQPVQHTYSSPSLPLSPEPSAEATQQGCVQGQHATAVAQLDPNRIEEVAHEASQLQNQFVSVLTHTKIEFSRKPAKFLAELSITLTTLPVSEKFKHLQFLRKKRDFFMNASSVDEIFKVLDDHWNYTEYALLQHLVQEFGGKALKREMNKYVADLEQFEKRTTIQESNTAAPNSSFSMMHGDYNSSTMELQLPRDPKTCTLYEARQVKESVAKRACLAPYVVHMPTIRSNSVTITLMCPRVVLELIVLALDREFLETHQIISVIIDKKPLEEYNEDYVKVRTSNSRHKIQYLKEVLGTSDL